MQYYKREGKKSQGAAPAQVSYNCRRQNTLALWRSLQRDWLYAANFRTCQNLCSSLESSARKKNVDQCYQTGLFSAVLFYLYYQRNIFVKIGICSIRWCTESNLKNHDILFRFLKNLSLEPESPLKFQVQFWILRTLKIRSILCKYYDVYFFTEQTHQNRG